MSVRDHNPIVFDKFNGLWSRGDPDNTPLDHFQDCNNIRFIGNSSFGTRYGIGISQTVLAPLSDIKRIYNYPTPTGNTLIVLVIDSGSGAGEIFHLVNATTVYGPILTIAGMNDFAFQPYAGRGYISPFANLPSTLNPPPTALLATLINGTDIEAGVHKYATTFITAAGETTPSPLTVVTTDPVGIADPLIAPVITTIGAGSNVLVAGGTYHWKFVYSADNGATLLTLPGPASTAYVAVAGKDIGLQTPSAFPAKVVLVGIYRTISGGGTYYRESAFTFPTNIPITSGGPSYVSVGNITDAAIIANPVAPVANNTTRGDVNLSNIPIGGVLVTGRNVYRTAANDPQLKLLHSFADNVTTVFSDTFADATLGANAPTVNSAVVDSTLVARGLEGEFLYVYAGDGTMARKAAGDPLTGTLVIANGASGHTDAGFHIFGFVAETISGYLTAPGALQGFTTSAGNSVSFGNVPTSGSPYITRRHLVASRAIVNFNGDLQGYTLFFVPGAIIENNTDTFLNNISFYDADLLSDASHLIDNFADIPAGAVLSMYHNRLVLADTFTDISLALVSAPGEPEAISQIDGIIVVPLDGNPITNAQELRDVLYTFKRARTVAYVDNGDVPATWPLVIVDNGLGTSVHGISTVLDSGSASVDFLIIATYQGVSLFNGKYITPELSWKIIAFWQALDRTNFNAIQILNAPIQKIIFIVLPNGELLVGDYGNGMDYKSIRWTPMSFFMPISTIGIVNISDIIIGAPLL